MNSMRFILARDEERHLDGLNLDTCANKAPVISKDQNLDYCGELGIMDNIKRGRVRRVVWIGGSLHEQGTVKLQTPFIILNLVIDVQYLVLEKIPNPPINTRYEE